MKIILTVFSALLTMTINAQQPLLIEYAAVSNFHWGLFEGKINPDHLGQMGQNTGAVTVSSISISTQQTSAKEATVLITARFHTQESWTRFPNLTQPAEALNHEKRHLDITEVYARKLRQAVSKTKLSSKNFMKELDHLFKDYVTQHRAEQVHYDHETNHSTVTEQQRKWDMKIDGQLKELSDYIDNKIVVRLD